RGFERDARGLFELIKVPEPEPGVSATIVDGMIAEASRLAGVEIVVPAEVRELAADLAGTYHPGLAEPGRSLRLLEDALELRTGGGEALIELGADDVIAGLAKKTGLPEQLLNDRKPLDASQVRAFFEERVLGQRAAVDAVVDLITLVKAGLTDPNKPLRVVPFLPPTS